MDTQILADLYPEENLLIADGFDEAILGVDESSMRVIYSVKKCIKILMEELTGPDGIREYFDFNVRGAYVGEKTPIWCDDEF